MKLSTPEIVWHSKQPVFTADFHKNGPLWRLATGGGDNDVKIWKVARQEDGVKISFLSNLSRHTKAVNIVRFSPNGEYLASAGDDNVLVLWTGDARGNGGENNLLADGGNKENWSVVKILRGHLEDVYDLSWSRDSSYIITGSVDNSAIVWDVVKGQQVSVLKDSRQYVQGVTWDPLGKVVVTMSNDRNLRVYGTRGHRCLHSISKLSFTDQNGESRQCRMWIDEGLNSFFRRLSFTPDGSFLIVPAGRYELENQSKNTTYVFARNNWSRPVLQLPGPEKPSVVVKCCPIPFALKQSDSSLTDLPYRMVYAVASLDSILFYDTQHSAPFAHISNIHYSGITDMAWSNDGLMLLVTSSDCYCSIIIFELHELGDPLASSVMFGTKDAKPHEIQPVTNCSGSSDRSLASNSPPPLSCPTGPQANISPSGTKVNSATGQIIGPAGQAGSPTGKPRRIRPTMISSVCSETVMSPDEGTDHKVAASEVKAVENSTTESPPPITTTTTAKVPRRVNLITLSSYKKNCPPDHEPLS